jgi:ribose 5-phosphate isomerase A
MDDARDAEMEAAAAAAAALVGDGAIVGLGTGVTVSHLLPRLVADEREHIFVATSIETDRAARRLGIEIRSFDEIPRLDIAIDGADQIAPDGWLIKGGGGAHTREKIVAAASDRFVVIASSNKEVPALRPPVPVELLTFGHAATLRALAPVRIRDAPRTPDAGILADYLGEIDDPRSTAAWLAAIPGVVGHGLFGPELVDDIIVGRGGDVIHRKVAHDSTNPDGLPIHE